MQPKDLPAKVPVALSTSMMAGPTLFRFAVTLDCIVSLKEEVLAV